MEDLLIQNAYIIDGTGTPGFPGTLSVRDGRISGIWRQAAHRTPARETLDAGGNVLCPGFVDTHTHSDMILLHDGRQPSSITKASQPKFWDRTAFPTRRSARTFFRPTPNT